MMLNGTVKLVLTGVLRLSTRVAVPTFSFTVDELLTKLTCGAGAEPVEVKTPMRLNC